MGRRRSQRACASAPSMLSSARGSPELRHRSESEAEVSAAAEGATGSEVAPPGDRGGRTRGSGRGSAATTSSTGEAEGAERGADTPARKPDPEAGRMDHHQLGTGRYQVVSARAPGKMVGRCAAPRRAPSCRAHLSSSPGPQPTACTPPSPHPGIPQLARALFPLPSFPPSLTQTPVSREWCPPAAGLGARTCQGGDRRPELCEVIEG